MSWKAERGRKESQLRRQQTAMQVNSIGSVTFHGTRHSRLTMLIVIMQEASSPDLEHSLPVEANIPEALHYKLPVPPLSFSSSFSDQYHRRVFAGIRSYSCLQFEREYNAVHTQSVTMILTPMVSQTNKTMAPPPAPPPAPPAAPPPSPPTALGVLETFPPEIRNHIYRLCLTAPGPITLIRHRRTEAMKANGGMYTNSLTGAYVLHSYVKDTKAHKIPTASLLGLALLQASQAVYAEAGGILYSENAFACTTSYALEEFLHMIGWRAAALCTLSVAAPFATKTSYSHILGLRRAADPKSIRIHAPRANVFLYGEGDDAESTAKETWYLIKEVVTERATQVLSGRRVVRVDRAEALRRLAAFEFVVKESTDFDVGDGTRGLIEDGEVRSARLHRLVRKLLRKDVPADKGVGA